MAPWARNRTHRRAETKVDRQAGDTPRRFPAPHRTCMFIFCVTLQNQQAILSRKAAWSAVIGLPAVGKIFHHDRGYFSLLRLVVQFFCFTYLKLLLGARVQMRTISAQTAAVVIKCPSLPLATLWAFKSTSHVSCLTLAPFPVFLLPVFVYLYTLNLSCYISKLHSRMLN